MVNNEIHIEVDLNGNIIRGKKIAKLEGRPIEIDGEVYSTSFEMSSSLPKSQFKLGNTDDELKEADKKKGGYVYAIKEGDQNTKIGSTKRDPNDRCKQLQTGNSKELSVEYSLITSMPSKVESEVHKSLKEQDRHVRGEFFNLPEGQAEKEISSAKEKIDQRIYLESDEDGWITLDSKEHLSGE